MSTTQSADPRQFEYLLNAMERAAQSDEPAKAGYAGARQAVLAYVAGLESQAATSAEPVAWGSLRAMQTINQQRSVRWMAGSPGWTTLEIAGELAGEVGELANVCKKLRRSEMGVPGNKVPDEVLLQQARGEIADVLIVLMLTASKLGIDLEDAVRETFNAKSEQMGFPERLNGASPAPQVAALREEVERLKALGSELADNENAYQEMADRERSLRAENQRLIEQVASLSAAKREHDAALLCIAALSKNEARVEELLAALPTGDATR